MNTCFAPVAALCYIPEDLLQVNVALNQQWQSLLVLWCKDRNDILPGHKKTSPCDVCNMIHKRQHRSWICSTLRKRRRIGSRDSHHKGKCQVRFFFKFRKQHFAKYLATRGTKLTLETHKWIGVKRRIPYGQMPGMKWTGAIDFKTNYENLVSSQIFGHQPKLAQGTRKWIRVKKLIP